MFRRKKIIMVYFGEVVFYILLGLVEYLTINQLSSFSFIILFYILPIICTLVVSLIKKGNLLTKNILSSILALIVYFVMGNIFNNMGTWSKFVTRNSIKTSNSMIQISNNMLNWSQIIFVLVLYFGIGCVIYFITKKVKGKNE